MKVGVAPDCQCLQISNDYVFVVSNFLLETLLIPDYYSLPCATDYRLMPLDLSTSIQCLCEVRLKWTFGIAGVSIYIIDIRPSHQWTPYPHDHRW